MHVPAKTVARSVARGATSELGEKKRPTEFRPSKTNVDVFLVKVQPLSLNPTLLLCSLSNVKMPCAIESAHEQTNQTCKNNQAQLPVGGSHHCTTTPCSVVSVAAVAGLLVVVAVVAGVLVVEAVVEAVVAVAVAVVVVIKAPVAGVLIVEAVVEAVVAAVAVAVVLVIAVVLLLRVSVLMPFALWRCENVRCLLNTLAGEAEAEIFR